MSTHELVGASTSAAAAEALLSARAVTKTYRLRGSLPQRVAGERRAHADLHALDGVDLDLAPGEVLALVGESGSGKSTLAKVLVGSASASSGALRFAGAAMPTRRDATLGRRIQMVFQDPYSSLNPRMTVGAILRELLVRHRIVPRRELRAECVRLLRLVGLEEDALDAYPGQFSGGQRQRIAIARALAVRPDVLIADEPVSALDVSIQATILELFATLRTELGLSILFVAHNLAVVQHLADRVAVMYLGRIVEIAPTAQLFADPRHPYTRALIASIPRMGPTSVNERFALEGDPPSPFDIPAGCRFSPRCPYAADRCREIDPALEPAGAGGAGGPHVAACIRSGELDSVAAARHVPEG